MTSTVYRLVFRARRKGLPKGAKPRPVTWVARQLGVNRTYVYALMRGQKIASPELSVRIAKGLGVTPATFRRAMRRTARRKL